MTISKDSGRQYPLTASATIAAADIPAIAVYEAFDLPGGAVVTGGVLEVVTVDSGGGTVKVTVDTVDLIAATSTAALLRVDLTETPPVTTAPTTVDIEVASFVLTTAVIRLTLTYVIAGRANEVNP